MPRPAGLRRNAAAALLALLAGAAAADPDCDRLLEVRADPDAPAEILVTLAAPCDPYAEIRIAYGPVVIREEASDAGGLALRLPRLPGAEAVAVEIAGSPLSAPVPPGAAPPAHFAAIDRGDAAPPARLEPQPPEAPIRRYALGFRAADGAPHLDLAVSEAPLVLVVPLTAARCGAELTLSAGLPGMAAPAPLRLALPDCPAPEGSLHLPLN